MQLHLADQLIAVEAGDDNVIVWVTQISVIENGFRVCYYIDY